MLDILRAYSHFYFIASAYAVFFIILAGLVGYNLLRLKSLRKKINPS